MANKLLDDAIKKYRIPRWPYEASYDRIVVFSVPEEKASRETYTPGGLIVKTEARKDYEEAETPRGVLVSAGLGALDVLRGHGIGLGHMVWVARLSPWRHEVDRDGEGRAIEFLFLRVGDIVGSETLQAYIKEQKVSVEVTADGNHRLLFHDEGVRARFDPPSWVA